MKSSTLMTTSPPPTTLAPLSFQTHSMSAHHFGVSPASVLSALAALAHPRSVIHVGAGGLVGDLHLWQAWSGVPVLLVDQDPQQIDPSLINGAGDSQELPTTDPVEVKDSESATAQNYPTRFIRSVVVAGESGSRDWFVSSNTVESGLIDATQLRHVWPSLNTAYRLRQDALSLDQLCKSTPQFQRGEPGWLFVDCFPAAEILSGATEVLDSISVVCVRVLFEPGFQGKPEMADLASVSGVLKPMGFIQVSVHPGLNPKVGYAVYVKSLDKKLISQARAADEVRAGLEAELTEKSHALVDAQSQLNKLQVELRTVKEEKVRALQDRDVKLLDLDTLRKKLLEAEDVKLSLLQSVSELKTTQTQLLGEIQNIKEENQSLQDDRVDKERTLQTMSTLLREREQQLSEVTSQVLTLKAALDEAKQDVVTSAATATSETQKAQAARTQLTELQQSVIQKDQMLAAINTEVDSLRNTVGDLNRTLDDKESVLQRVQSELAEHSEKLESGSQTIQELQRQLATTQKRLTDAQSEKVSALESLQKAHADEVAKLRQEIDNRQKELDEFRQSLDSLHQQVQELDSVKAERQRLQMQNSELELRQQLMNEELVKAEGQITLIKDLLLREQGI